MRKLAPVKFLGIAVMSALLALSAGCNSKKSKCQRGWDQAADMAKSVSGIANLVGKALGKDFNFEDKIREVEPKFMEVCMQLPDEAMDCVANFKEKFLEPSCLGIIAKLPRPR